MESMDVDAVDGTAKPEEKTSLNVEDEKCEFFEDYPYTVKVKNLPAKYDVEEFKSYVKTQFDLEINKITQHQPNSFYLLIHCATNDESDLYTMALDCHTWNKRPLVAMQLENPPVNNKEDPPKEIEDETIDLIVHLRDDNYKEHHKIQDLRAKSMCNLLHADICSINKALIPWAEASVAKNSGFLLEILPMIPYPDPKLKHIWSDFAIGKNEKGELSVGYVSKRTGFIINIYPGESFIHISDSLKLVAQKLSEYLRLDPKEVYSKDKTTGYWHKVYVRELVDGSYSLLIFAHKNKQMKEEESNKIKEELKEFFLNGPGKEANVSTLAIQMFDEYGEAKLSESAVVLFGEELAVEEICGLKLIMSPATPLNVYRRETCDSIRDAVLELGEINKDKNVFVMRYGTGGINVSLAPHCNQFVAYASIPTYSCFVRESYKLNNITNAEVVNKVISEEVDVKNILEKLGSEKETVVILDNLKPMANFKPSTLELIREMKNIKRIIYIFVLPSLNFRPPFALKHLTGTPPQKSINVAGHPFAIKHLAVSSPSNPFLPTKFRAVDSSAYRRDKIIVMAFDKVDPKSFPPATAPAPVPNHTHKTLLLYEKSSKIKSKMRPRVRQAGKDKNPSSNMRSGPYMGFRGRREPPAAWRGPFPRPLPYPDRSRMEQEELMMMRRREMELREMIERREQDQLFMRRNEQEMEIRKLEMRLAELESRQLNPLDRIGGSGENYRGDWDLGFGTYGRGLGPYGQGGGDRGLGPYGRGGGDRGLGPYGRGGGDRVLGPYGRECGDRGLGPYGRGGGPGWDDWNYSHYNYNSHPPPLMRGRGNFQRR